jgi:hypothetical protein
MVSVSCGFSALLPQLQCRHWLRPCDLSAFGGLVAFFGVAFLATLFVFTFRFVFLDFASA